MAENFLVPPTQEARKRKGGEKGLGFEAEVVCCVGSRSIQVQLKHLVHILHFHCRQWYFKQVDTDIIKMAIWQHAYLLYGRQSKSRFVHQGNKLTPTGGTSSKKHCCFDRHGPLPVALGVSKVLRKQGFLRYSAARKAGKQKKLKTCDSLRRTGNTDFSWVSLWHKVCEADPRQEMGNWSCCVEGSTYTGRDAQCLLLSISRLVI